MGELLRSFIFLVTLIGISGSMQAAGIDGSSIQNMSPTQKAQFRNFLTTQRCDCGCKLTVAMCLRTMKSCHRAPSMAQSKIQQLLATTKPAPVRSPPPTHTGKLDSALFGVWRRRTTNSNRYVSIHASKKIAFSRNGFATYGTGAIVSGGGPNASIRTSGGVNIADYGRWSARGNTLYIHWKKAGKVQWKYIVFAHDGSQALKLGNLFYKFYSK